MNRIAVVLSLLLLFSSCGEIKQWAESDLPPTVVSSLPPESSSSLPPEPSSSLPPEPAFPLDGESPLVIPYAPTLPVFNRVEVEIPSDEILQLSVPRTYHLLTKSGKLFTWGDNPWGSLGLDFQSGGAIVTPTQVAFPEPIVKFYDNIVKSTTNFAVGESGKLYGWGDNRYGFVQKIQFPDTPGFFGDYIPYPVEMDLPFPITDLSCSPMMMTVKDDKGNWYGKGKKANYGTSMSMLANYFRPDEVDQDWVPIIFPTDREIIKSVTDFDYRAFLSDDGKVYFHGYAAQAAAYPTLSEIEYPEPIKDISPMERGLVALGVDGTAYYLGDDGDGVFGDGPNKYPTPVAIDKITSPIKMLDTSPFSIMVYTEDGKLYTWGSNSAFSVSPDNQHIITTPILVEIPGEVVSFDRGWGSAYAKTSDNNYYAWGGNFREFMVPEMGESSELTKMEFKGLEIQPSN